MKKMLIIILISLISVICLNRPVSATMQTVTGSAGSGVATVSLTYPTEILVDQVSTVTCGLTYPGNNWLKGTNTLVLIIANKPRYNQYANPKKLLERILWMQTWTPAVVKSEGSFKDNLFISVSGDVAGSEYSERIFRLPPGTQTLADAKAEYYIDCFAYDNKVTSRPDIYLAKASFGSAPGVIKIVDKLSEETKSSSRIEDSGSSTSDCSNKIKDNTEKEIYRQLSMAEQKAVSMELNYISKKNDVQAEGMKSYKNYFADAQKEICDYWNTHTS